MSSSTSASRWAGRWVPPWTDVAVAGAFVLMTLAEALLSPEVPSVWRHLLLTGTAMVALAWRRLAPLSVAALVVCAHLLGNPQGEFSVLLSLVLVCYTVGAETDAPRSQVGLAAVLVPFVAASAVAGLEPSDLAAAGVFLVGPWAVGVSVRHRTARTDEAMARAARLEAEHRQQAAAAVAAERTRIARELHDIVSHSLSVVTIQTQAVRRRLRPDQQAEAADLVAVEGAAREALAEMRRLFGMLRADGESASLAPQPGLEEIRRLVRQVGNDRLAVELEVEGDPQEVSPGIALAAYRIAQEGLTNAVRHAAATTVTVRLRFEPAALRVEVDDDGRGPRARVPSAGGHGLIGIRERVALYGGTVELAERPGGGTRLSAFLPLREAS